MKCKRCHSQVDQDDKNCKFCGEKITKGAWGKILGIMLLLATLTGGGLYIYLTHTGVISLRSPAPEIDAPVSPEPAEPPETTPSPLPAPLKDAPEEFEAVWPSLRDIYAAANNYIHNNQEKSTFITKDGYLYNHTAQAYITLDNLADEGFLTLSDINHNFFFIYVRPCDFSSFSEVNFSNSSQLEIFSAYETNTGVALYSQNDSGFVYRENLNSLLTSYHSDHGNVTRPTATWADYDAILEAVSSHEFEETGYYARYIANDDQYAIAALSGEDDLTLIRHFALKKNEGGWAVIADDLEKSPSPEIQINNAAPDFNMALMPPYRLDNITLLSKDAFVSVEEKLLETGDVLEDDFPPAFVSGNKDYVYMVFSSGKIFWGQLADGQWETHPASNWIEAEIAMSEKSGEPPTYMIWQK